jgi:hypothetical protein
MRTQTLALCLVACLLMSATMADAWHWKKWHWDESEFCKSQRRHCNSDCPGSSSFQCQEQGGRAKASCSCKAKSVGDQPQPHHLQDATALNA